jgi:Zn-dependent protease
MIGVPGSSPFDLRFRLLGLPVRISPWFWLIALFLTWNAFNEDPVALVLAVGVILVSILVHEFGHGLISRLCGARVSEVVLYQFGGVCAHEPISGFWKNIAIVAAGPLAGLLLGGLSLLVMIAMRLAGFDPARYLSVVLSTLIFINIFWSIFNLLPIWPLDGGQITGLILGKASPRNGRRWTHIVGLVGAGIIAVFFSTRQEFYLTILFALIAFDNFQILQVLHQWHRYGDEGFDDSDWWKR